MEDLFSSVLNSKINSFCPKGMLLPITKLMFCSTYFSQTVILRKRSVEKADPTGS